MTSTSTTFKTDLSGAANQATEHLREFGERTYNAGRVLGQLAIENYERAVAGLIDAEHQAAESTDVEWIKAAIGAHAGFVQQVSDAYVKAARAALA